MTSSKSKPIFLIMKNTAKYLLLLIVVIYVFIWLASPYMVRYFVKEPLKELGLSLDSNSSVRFNPFISTLIISDLSLLDKIKQEVLTIERLEVSVHLHRLALKQIYISKFKLKNTALSVQKAEESILVAGINLFNNSIEEQTTESKDIESSPPDFTLVIPYLNIADFSVLADIDGNKQNLTLDDFTLNDVVVNQVEQDVALRVKAKINGAPLLLESTVSMSEGNGEIDSILSLTKLDLSEISPIMPDIGIESSGFLSVHANPMLVLKDNRVNINSDKATITLESLLLNYTPWIVAGDREEIELNDLFIVTTSQGELSELSFKLTGEFSKGNIGLVTLDNSLANWGGIDFSSEINMIDMKPNVLMPTLNFELLNLSQDLTSESLASMLSTKNIGIQDVSFAENLLSINTIKVNGLITHININSDKTIASMLDMSGLDAPELEVSSEDVLDEIDPEIISNDKASSVGIVLNKLTFEDDAYIFISDSSVSPTYDQKITIETLQIGPLNSLDTHLQSPFELKAKDQNYLKIDASGFVSPFGDTLNASLLSNVNELSLPSVSPYMKDTLGFEMKSGQLDLKLDVEVIDDQIAGDTTIFMRGIEMASADEVEQGTIKEGKAMPLNIALGLLKDDQDNIELTVPLRGDVASPSFGVESFIGLVLKKAAMSQAKDYLMTTFVPYASVVSVALSGAEYLLKVKFEPLLFGTGVVSLTDENQQYLSELVLLMQDKPELQLKTCSVSNYHDLAIEQGTPMTTELKSEIKVLGDKRQSNLKAYLIEQGIKSSRILYCAPELDTSDNGQPRIELKTD
ncbi:MAG: DUF748 domain-containing protein [Paraglaciecola sp.]|uniref:DUF748 domain-containing protein n=1 Tax=Paraglaciecola sp. TaxID=1920173 RepID=UPI003297D2CD